MNNFIVAFAVSVVLLSCTTGQSKKLDVVGQINQDIIKNPSAAGGTGTNYYVCDDGDDANDGLSEETPWKTFDKAILQFNKIDAGDAILLCRGGEFISTYSKRLYNTRCLAEDPCIFSDYYNYNTQVEDKRPVIRSTHTSRVFSFQDGGAADHDEGYKIENLILSGKGKGIGGAIFFYNDVDDVILNNLTIDSFDIAVQVAGSNNERILLTEVEATNVDYWLMGVADGEVTNIASTRAVSEVINNKEVQHYFVCDTGNDSSNGLSPNSPYRTFSKGIAQFNALKAGGSVSFCRGGEFFTEGANKIYNPNCTAERNCVIQDYIVSGGVNSMPVIYNTIGGSIFRIMDGGNADPDGGYLIRNLVLKAQITGKGTGISIYNDVDDLTIHNVTIDGFSWGILLSGSGPVNEGANGFNDRVVIKNSRIINNSAQGLFGSCNDCTISSNLFDNNGYDKKILNHNIYIGGHVENMTISDNILRRSAIVDGKCTAVSLVVHGVANNLTIENNSIEEGAGVATHGCWGISVDPGYTKEEKFTNIIIRNNDIVNMGNVSIGCASCVNVLIEGNRMITHRSLGGAFIKIPSKPEDSVVSENITIRNNSMINSDLSANTIGIHASLLNGVPFLGNNSFLSSSELTRCQYINGEEVDDSLKCKYSKY